MTALTHGWSWLDAAAPADGATSGWTDLAHPADAWPQLAAYLPVGATWRHSDDYDAALPPSTWNVAFLDATDKVLLVFSFDH